MHDLISQILNGLQLGSLYALIALGYTMVYGVLKLINFAHGDVYMVGSYVGMFSLAFLEEKLHIVPNSLLEGIAILLIAMSACAVLGVLIEKSAYQPLRKNTWVAPTIMLGFPSAYIAIQIAMDSNRTPTSSFVIGAVVFALIAWLLFQRHKSGITPRPNRLTALITAIGVSIFLENFGVLPQIFGSDPSSINFTMPDAAKVGGFSYDPRTFAVFGISLFLMLVLSYTVGKTKIGRAIRAVSFDADAAALMGINTDRVISITFGIGAALAGAAAVIVPVLTETSFTPYVGAAFGLKAFVAAVLGGIGNIPGAMLGGLIMGLAETLAVAYGPLVGIPSTYRDAVAFVILIVILLFRPAGILGKFVPEKV